MPDNEDHAQDTSQASKQCNRKIDPNNPDRENEEEDDEEEAEDTDFNPCLIADSASEASSSLSSEDEGSADCVNIDPIQDSDISDKGKDKNPLLIADTFKDSHELLQKDEEDAICTRTRARHSLADYSLEELETFLQESEDDEDLQNVDDEEEYRKFLSAVLGSGNDIGNEKDADENMDEDEDNDADFEIEIEEALDSDAEDNNRGNEEKDGIDPEVRQKRTQRSSKRRPLGQVKTTAVRPILPSINGQIESATQSIARSQFSQRLPIVEPNYGFSSNQVGQLFCLINEHVQLLIQVYSLSAYDPARQYIADKAQVLLLEMAEKRDEALNGQRIPYPVTCFDDMKAYKSTNFSYAPLVSNPMFSILDIKSLSFARKFIEDVSASILRYQKEQMSGTHVESKLKKEPLFPLQNCSVAEETNAAEGLNDSDYSVKTKKTFAATLVGRTKTQSALVPSDIATLAQTFRCLFNPSLFPHKPPPFPVANRILFTDSEDGLLAMGIMEYNNDWRAIQRRFLPGKSEHQIYVRQKNRTSSKAPENPIKAVRRMKTSPLTAEEKALIAEGLRRFKHEWVTVWRLFVPHRDPHLLPRQWRAATGTQKSYRKDDSVNEKRRVYEARRRKLKASSADWKSTMCEQEIDEAEDEDETYIHEAFISDNDPASFEHQESNSHINENFRFTRSEAQQMVNYLPSTSSHVHYTYRQRKGRGAKVVKLAPELPPVNLPPSVRVISQSAFRSYQPDKNPEKVLLPRMAYYSKASGRSKNALQQVPGEGNGNPETDDRIHPLLFQTGDAGLSVYPPIADRQGGPSVDFHPMLQRMGDISNGGPSRGLELSANSGTVHDSAVSQLLVGEKDNAVGFEPGVCLEESEDQVSGEIVMEQEELSDSEEDDDVNFECEEMDDSESEDVDPEPSRDAQKE